MPGGVASEDSCRWDCTRPQTRPGVTRMRVPPLGKAYIVALSTSQSRGVEYPKPYRNYKTKISDGGRILMDGAGRRVPIVRQFTDTLLSGSVPVRDPPTAHRWST